MTKPRTSSTFDIARDLYASRRYEEALAHLRNAALEGWPQEQTLPAIAASLYHLGREAEARAAYQQMLDANIQVAEARRMLARLTPGASTQTHADSQALPGPRHMSGPVITGTVVSVATRQMAVGATAGYMPTIQTRHLTAVEFRMLTDSGPRTVILRGVRFEGPLPEKGDRIAVPARGDSRSGFVVDMLENLNTHELLVARQPSRVLGVLRVVGITFAILWVIAIFAMVIGGFIFSADLLEEFGNLP